MNFHKLPFNEPHKLVVVIGRFQPFHNGHQRLIDSSLTDFTSEDHLTKTLVLVGSSNKARSLDNPLTYEERVLLLQSEYQDQDNLTIAPLADYDYDDKSWELNLHNMIKQAGEQMFNGEYFLPVFIAGDKGGDAELRQAWARNTEMHSLPVFDKLNGEPLSASALRELWAEDGPVAIKGHVPDITFNFLNGTGFLEVDRYLADETEMVQKYKKSWSKAPFAPTFMATDAVVRDTSGRFLMIERGGDMGKGSIALAGGFLEVDLTHEQNMRKELFEETNLDLDNTDHEIVVSWFCDAPKRAKRGRMTTMVYLVQLDTTFEELDLQAGDDAAKIHFMSFEQLQKTPLFNDHMGLTSKVLTLEAKGVRYENQR